MSDGTVYVDIFRLPKTVNTSLGKGSTIPLLGLRAGLFFAIFLALHLVAAFSLWEWKVEQARVLEKVLILVLVIVDLAARVVLWCGGGISTEVPILTAADAVGVAWKGLTTCRELRNA
jgi:hypothetical protein